MIVQVDFTLHNCYVIKEAGDRSYYWGWSSPESKFLNDVKNVLIGQGYNVMKKRMWKDGHLVSSEQMYIRTREYNKKGKWFCIYNSSYSIYDAGEFFNDLKVGQCVCLMVDNS